MIDLLVNVVRSLGLAVLFAGGVTLTGAALMLAAWCFRLGHRELWASVDMVEALQEWRERHPEKAKRYRRDE